MQRGLVGSEMCIRDSPNIKMNENKWLLLIVVVSVLLALLWSTAKYSSDFWTHLNWMKITHRLPLCHWYTHEGHFQLDYPPFEAYVHYAMGFLFKLFDSDAFLLTPMNSSIPVTASVKYGVRIAIIVVSLLFYYPAVIYFVRWYYQKANVRLYLIAILLNMPLFVQIEFMNTQVNSPSLGCLIWSLYFAMTQKYSWCASFFVLSCLAKQITVPCVLPIGFFILSNLYHDGVRICRAHWLRYVILNCLKILSAGILTLFISISPFLIDKYASVSYTHLTLPTILLVQISVVAVSLKKKKQLRKATMLSRKR
eukprot:TRINITY_DN29878_c0_g1_i4.p1 TRINITY_DN29878_c0_g1~~TRINITY_DN29878_c0_g1_i4.p1  ORF type:complete len:310 (-),score=35.16 TRINITY_DN29878_c0_g1_i4:25-954(-)